MRKLQLLVFVLLASYMAYGQLLTRAGQIKITSNEATGFGGIVAGVDFDGDGNKEIYAVNNNIADAPFDMVPKIYKYEFNGTGWDSVWAATLPLNGQNTWPAITSGDLDNDGKMEIIWSPVNYLNATTNPNPIRIAVFEAKGDGSDVMGVADGNNFKPNAQWTITSTAMQEIRPIRFMIVNADNDAAPELLWADRGSLGYKFGVASVNNIPDNGDRSEVWTLEANGTSMALGLSTVYDVNFANKNIYVIDQNGKTAVIGYNTDSSKYLVKKILTGAVPGGSWRSTQVADLDNDGIQEFVSGNFLAGNSGLYLNKLVQDSIVSTKLFDLTTIGVTTLRIYGCAMGDIDSDGKIDFVFGTRDTKPNASIINLEYQGGDITSPASYTVRLIDTAAIAAGGRWGLVEIANLDGDPANEVIYGNEIDPVTPLYVIDNTGFLPVELKSFNALVNKNSVNLTWLTATEKNNAGFEIQRKSNGEFETIAFVKGNGTTTNFSNYSYTDNNLTSGKFTYRLRQIDLDGTYSLSNEIDVDLTTPMTFSLDQNYPNPFNPSTKISFTLPAAGNVTLKIFNTNGEEVATLINNESKEAGFHNLGFDASHLTSGVYVYSIQFNNSSISKKMMLVK